VVGTWYQVPYTTTTTTSFLVALAMNYIMSMSNASSAKESHVFRSEQSQDIIGILCKTPLSKGSLGQSYYQYHQLLLPGTCSSSTCSTPGWYLGVLVLPGSLLVRAQAVPLVVVITMNTVDEAVVLLLSDDIMAAGTANKNKTQQ